LLLLLLLVWCLSIPFRSMAVLSSIRDQLRFGLGHGMLGWEDGNRDRYGEKGTDEMQEKTSDRRPKPKPRRRWRSLACFAALFSSLSLTRQHPSSEQAVSARTVSSKSFSHTPTHTPTHYENRSPLFVASFVPPARLPAGRSPNKQPSQTHRSLRSLFSPHLLRLLVSTVDDAGYTRAETETGLRVVSKSRSMYIAKEWRVYGWVGNAMRWDGTRVPV
jgi:hypothetical protein